MLFATSAVEKLTVPSIVVVLPELPILIDVAVVAPIFTVVWSMLAASVVIASVYVTSPVPALYVNNVLLSAFLIGLITKLLTCVLFVSTPVAFITIEFAAWFV